MILRTLLAAVALSVHATGADWPQLLGPTRDGVYPGKQSLGEWPKDGPAKLWTHEVGSGWSGPVAANGRVIVFHRVDDEEVAECLEARTGKLLWKTSFATRYVDGFGFDNGPRATPAIADGGVFLFGANGNFHCVDLQSGKTRWSVDLRESLRTPTGYFGLACSPLVVGDLVLLNIGAPAKAGIVAFHTRSGEVRWKATDDEASYSSPVLAKIAGKAQAVFFTRHNLFGIDPASGRELWKQPWSPSMQASVSASVPLVQGDTLFATASYGAGAVALRIHGNSVKKLWEGDDSLSCQYQTPLLHRGHLYGFHGRLDTGPRPEFRCVELATGKVKWSTRKADAGSLIRIGDEALILSVNGELIRFNATPEGYRETARTQVLGLETRAHPALANGLFLARDKRRLICLDLR